jgi:hypothetical protein
MKRRIFASLQFFQQGDEAVLLAIHAETTELGELDGFTCGHENGHGIAGVAAGFQRRKDGLHMFFNEQHVGDDDVGGGDVGLAGFKC